MEENRRKFLARGEKYHLGIRVDGGICLTFLKGDKTVCGGETICQVGRVMS